MRILLRLIAILAALSVGFTVVFIVAFAGRGGFRQLDVTSVLGAATYIDWAITLVAGPITAMQLWRLRHSGRRAGVLMFGAGLAYYVMGLFVRSPGTPLGPIVLATTVYALPVAVLLSRRARATCTQGTVP